MEHWQTLEAEAFIARILSLPKGPGVSLDEVLQPSLDDEAELRKLFATDKANSRLKDPYAGLIDVFAAPPEVRTTRARVVKDEQDLSAEYVMPLIDVDRRKEGTPSMVADLDEFKKNWKIFTERSLSQLLDWNNVVVAGGAVLACLSSLSDLARESKRSIRKYYHSAAYPTSDVDLFLWGLDPEQAEIKINSIYEAVRESVPWEVTCVRTKHTISIHSQYPCRSVQIVLRLYSSPAEILAGFDIDAPCCLYNGQRVFANPRAIVAMMRQCNTVDMTRRSPSYEVRLAKYSNRAFEVYIPTLKRGYIDPTIYERSVTQIGGLARLLAFEKLADASSRETFIQSRKRLRGRPSYGGVFHCKRERKGDLKADMSVGGLKLNDYDVATLHIPYGPGWDARRINQLVYQTDMGMNSTFNPKNKDRRLHRHPAFFGTMKECKEDCCEHCPEPIDAGEHALQMEEDKQYIRGRISFIKENPGRQSISGSFNPIDVGEWSAQAYIGETEHFFIAVAAHDREIVFKMVTDDGIDINCRDHIGRTALHVAILGKATDIACDLIDAGARISARLVDGRNALHIAAQSDQPIVIRKLLERSVHNQNQLTDALENDGEDIKEGKGAVERPSSEDDWSSEDGGVIVMNTEDGDGDDESEGDRDPPKQLVASRTSTASDDVDLFAEDQNNTPDVLNVNLLARDSGFTPLAYAALFASQDTLEVLLTGGADPQVLNTTRDFTLQLLAVLIIREDEDEASRILERLVLAGASTSTADDQMRTIFHRAVMADKLKLVSSILRCDPNAKAALDFPAFVEYGGVILPVVSAIAAGKYAMLTLLLAHGAKLVFTEENILKALSTAPITIRQNISRNPTPILHRTYAPLEVAIARRDYVAQLLITLGAEVNVRISKEGFYPYAMQASAISVMDWVQRAIASASTAQAKVKTVTDPSAPLSPKSYAVFDPTTAADHAEHANRVPSSEDKKFKDRLDYLRNIEGLLASHGAKTVCDSIYPNGEPSIPQPIAVPNRYVPKNRPLSYFLITSAGSETIPPHLNPAYGALYKACIAGDNKTIRQLCLPQDGLDANEWPLNIYVQIAAPDSRPWCYNQHVASGITPLYIAIAGRRWDTARLVLAIAAAQYHPDNDEKRFIGDDIHLGDISDSESKDCRSSSGINIIIDEGEAFFINIAKKPSKVQTDVHPRKLLDEIGYQRFVKQPNGNYSISSSTHLAKAVAENDFDAFINIANLYATSPLPIAIGPTVLRHIIAMDRPDMLDEYIRRTGGGIDSGIIQERGTEIIATKGKNRLYLGLHVHGKKRTDFTKQNNRYGMRSETETAYLILWKACLAGAKGIVKYLGEDRPLVAYRFYASTGKDEFALQLRRTADLEEVLPQWLGWVVTPLRESPLMAGVLGRNLDVVKMLFVKNPKLMGLCIHDCAMFTGYNALMIAAAKDCSPALVDFLLAKSVSPMEKDCIRGWNIYHILCAYQHCDLLDHLLQKLPQDVSEMLLAQQSKNRLNTPLHIAVKSGSTRATKLIVAFSKLFAASTLLLRNIDGRTPLHCAVHSGFSEITEHLSKELPPLALHMEDGVGKTPLEIASVQFLRTREFKSQYQHFITPPTLSSSTVNLATSSPQADVVQLEGELLKLRATIGQLMQEGLLIKGTKITDELVNFADMMDTKLAEAKVAKAMEADSVGADAQPAAPTLPVGQYQPTGYENRPSARGRTLDVVSNAVSAAPGKRQLIRLLDVQKSVQDNLARHAKTRETNQLLDEDELKLHEDAKHKEQDGSLVLRYIGSGAWQLDM